VLPQLEPKQPSSTTTDAVAISLGIDRTCAPMAEPRGAERPRHGGERARARTVDSPPSPST
jgi:hypothetical protein